MALNASAISSRMFWIKNTKKKLKKISFIETNVDRLSYRVLFQFTRIVLIHYNGFQTIYWKFDRVRDLKTIFTISNQHSAHPQTETK